jgi:hypothetical protein
MSISDREKRLILEAVEKLDLDLSGLVVLTEAASGNYKCSPLICAAAGCDRVLAVTRDSPHGSASEVTSVTMAAASDMDFADRVNVVTQLTDAMWGSADIVTNLGFVRPISRSIVAKLKSTAAVPLMFETWEYRDDDLDLAACWERGICVLGTNEEHGVLRIMDYLGALVAKKLFENGVEVIGSRLVVLGKGRFFFKVCGALERMGAVVMRWLADIEDAYHEIASKERLEALVGVDAVIVADEPMSTRCVVGTAGFVSPKDIADNCPDAIVLQLAGTVSRQELEASGIKCIPETGPAPGHMGWSLSELGPKPVIDLHAGGLKVGELLARGRLAGLSPAEATARASEHPVCQVFSPEQRRRYARPF